MPMTLSAAPDKRLRVVHLVSSLNVGGLEKVVLNLVEQTSRERVTTSVVCLDRPGALASRFVAANVPVYTVYREGQGRSRRVYRLFSLLRTIGAHVLHTHNPGPHVHGVLAGRLARVPVIVHTKHGRNYPNQPSFVRLNRMASLASDAIVAGSNDCAEVATTIEKVPPRKVLVIRNGISVDRACPERVMSRSAVSVARLDPITDHHTLLEATRIVADARPDFSLDLVGDGPSRPAIESTCERLGLRPHVRLLGHRADVSHALAGAGMFVWCSTSEGLSMTLLEAMAARLPVVATRVGGNGEVVRDGVTGLLVPPRSPSAVARAILTLLDNPDLRARMGAAGRAVVEDEFSLAACVAQYERLYMMLAAAKGISGVVTTRLVSMVARVAGAAGTAE